MTSASHGMSLDHHVVCQGAMRGLDSYIVRDSLLCYPCVQTGCRHITGKFPLTVACSTIFLWHARLIYNSTIDGMTIDVVMQMKINVNCRSLYNGIPPHYSESIVSIIIDSEITLAHVHENCSARIFISTGFNMHSCALLCVHARVEGKGHPFCVWLSVHAGGRMDIKMIVKKN